MVPPIGDVVIGDVVIEEKPEWLKIVMPVKRRGLMALFFSLLLVAWLAMLVYVIAAMFRERFGFLLNAMLVVWLVIYLFLGRVLWRRWEYFAANREILFVSDEQLILRRPVSILGSTETYDRKHVSRLYHSDKHHCPAFDYAYQHVYLGRDLAEDDARELVLWLNQRLFPEDSDAL